MFPSFSSSLFAWFDAHRRDLPWRQHCDPYRVWVSEVMLQQTQVDAAIPFYLRFLERFPTMERLASANLEELLKAWEGLGYYSRAKNLLVAARKLTAQGYSFPPADRDLLLSLPGIGPYSAGAILSIAYGLPEPAVDGNVQRVLSRCFDIEEPLSNRKGTQKMEALVRSLIPQDRPGDFNQALMDLGSLVCRPLPLCSSCPLEPFCVAHAGGFEKLRPVRKPKMPSCRVFAASGILVLSGKVLVRKRPDGGLWSGMFEFPWVEGPFGLPLDKALAEKMEEMAGFGVEVGPALASVRHSFTHHRVFLNAFAVFPRDSSLPLTFLERRSDTHAVWVGLSDLDALPFQAGSRKLLALLGSFLLEGSRV